MRLFLTLTVWSIEAAYSALHSLTYMATTFSGVSNFPWYVDVGLVDSVVFACYDSNSTRVKPKQDWMRRLSTDYPEYLKRETRMCRNDKMTSRDTMEGVQRRFNQTGGVHTLQVMKGCEWDDETGEVRGHYQVAYDGEDFLSFDLKTQTWIARTPQADSDKQEWDDNKSRNKYLQSYLTQYCPTWLKTFLDYGNSSLLRTELPRVSLLQKTPSSPIVCHATGFYPPGAKLLWTKDGEELYEDVGEVLPNLDGTFQMMVQLTPSEDWGRYTCVFQLDGVEEDLVTPLTEEVILTNRKPKNLRTIAGTVAAVVLFITSAAVGGRVIKDRRGELNWHIYYT